MDVFMSQPHLFDLTSRDCGQHSRDSFYCFKKNRKLKNGENIDMSDHQMPLYSMKAANSLIYKTFCNENRLQPFI